jgi:hypothetical protein
MFYSPHSFINMYPSNKSIKLLLPTEKERKLQFFTDININVHNIYVDDPYCIFLRAKVGDMICIRNNKTDVYRYVIPLSTVNC